VQPKNPAQKSEIVDEDEDMLMEVGDFGEIGDLGKVG
jgi:hypothetical protein